MVKHNIGDKVIAISSNNHEKAQNRIKGNIYVVKDVIYCTKCGEQLVNIGIGSFRNNFRCLCGNRQYNELKKWTYAKEFIPINKQTIKEMELQEEYEICEIIKKQL